MAATLSVLGGGPGRGRGVHRRAWPHADGDGVVVRNTLRARSIPWRDLAAIEFKEERAEQIVRHASDPVRDSEVWDISALDYKPVFQRHDGSRVTAEAPAGSGIRSGEYLFELRERLLAMRSAASEDQEGDLEDSWPTYPAESHVQGAATEQPKDRSWTVRDWLLIAFFVVFVIFFGLPAFLIVVIDSLPVVGDWLTVHVPFWDEVTDFYDWLWSYAE